MKMKNGMSSKCKKRKVRGFCLRCENFKWQRGRNKRAKHYCDKFKYWLIFDNRTKYDRSLIKNTYVCPFEKEENNDNSKTGELL